MGRILIFSLMLLFSPLAKAGFFYKDLEFKAMENFSVERNDEDLVVRFDYVINNPNWYGIVIKPSSLFLKIAGTDCGWVRIEDKIKIKRKSEGSYPFALKGDPGDFVKSAFSSIMYLLSGKPIDFNMSGKMKAGVAFFRIKFQLDYTYELTFDEFMSFF